MDGIGWGYSLLLRRIQFTSLELNFNVYSEIFVRWSYGFPRMSIIGDIHCRSLDSENQDKEALVNKEICPYLVIFSF